MVRFSIIKDRIFNVFFLLEYIGFFSLNWPYLLNYRSYNEFENFIDELVKFSKRKHTKQYYLRKHIHQPKI